MQQRVEDVRALEVGFTAIEVNVSARRKVAFLVEDEADAPAAALDEFLAVPAACLPGGRDLRAVDALQAMPREGEASGALERLAAGHLGCRAGQAFEQHIRALVRRAHRMEPAGHLAPSERVWQAFAEAQLSPLQGLPAAATLGAPGGGGFEDVGHAQLSRKQKPRREAGVFFLRVVWCPAPAAPPAPRVTIPY